MKISVISPVKNEVDFIGYSIMSVLPYVHEIIYTCAASIDGTDDLIAHIADKYAHHKLRTFYGPNYDFDPLDMKAYNDAYNAAIDKSTGDAVWFLHPDMIVTNPEAIKRADGKSIGALAYYTHVTSYARDLKTEILAGRSKQWKNIHRKEFGLHYFGGYGSVNEDFYHRDITGTSYRHYGTEFAEYPYEIADSGIEVNHYCELKSYARRLEKMRKCLRTQHPGMDDSRIDELAKRHPRVTLDAADTTFGRFEFGPSSKPVPDVFEKYGDEFRKFKKEPVNV